MRLPLGEPREGKDFQANEESPVAKISRLYHPYASRPLLSYWGHSFASDLPKKHMRNVLGLVDRDPVD